MLNIYLFLYDSKDIYIKLFVWILQATYVAMGGKEIQFLHKWQQLTYMFIHCYNFASSNYLVFKTWSRSLASSITFRSWLVASKYFWQACLEFDIGFNWWKV
jgi:hypothetical protein